MRTPTVISPGREAGLPTDLSRTSTVDLLAVSDRMYRLLDQGFPSPGVCGLYQDVTDELDARGVAEPIAAGVPVAEHS